MGWSCSWIAVRGKPAEVLLGELGLRRSGERVQVPESPWTGAPLPGGWYLVFSARHCEPHEFNNDALQRLSAGCELVASSVEEHVMFCSSAYWKNGGRVWSIVHDAQEGIYHLAAEGNPPASFTAIRDRYFGQQEAEGGAKAGVDLVFEIPLTVGVEVTGFRHDHDFPVAEPAPFEALGVDVSAEERRAGKPWWRIW